MPKAEAAARRLKRINSAIRYEPITDDINPGNVERIVAGAAVVVDGLDNFYTRALVNQACVKHGNPLDLRRVPGNLWQRRHDHSRGSPPA